jgi:serine/threonine protein kinase
MLTPSAPASSRILSHYRLETGLGEGGMGVVYEAYDTQLERYVPIKLVREPLLAEPEARDQLIAEARSASALNHPNICTVHDIGQSKGETYIVMERVEGQPLSSLITGGLSPEQVVSYGGQIADALAHAHAHGIVHRDLKSANVMITPEGRSRFSISDWLPVFANANCERLGHRESPLTRSERLPALCTMFRLRSCTGSRRTNAPTHEHSASCATRWPPDSCPSAERRRLSSAQRLCASNQRALLKSFLAGSGR